MATIVAKFKFDSKNEWDIAYERIVREVGSYSSCGYDYSSSYGYEITIYDTCEKVTLAGQICRASGGILN
jgi:hypothetical protein